MTTAYDRLKEFVSGARGPYSQLPGDIAALLDETSVASQIAETENRAVQFEAIAVEQIGTLEDRERDLKVVIDIIDDMGPMLAPSQKEEFDRVKLAHALRMLAIINGQRYRSIPPVKVIVRDPSRSMLSAGGFYFIQGAGAVSERDMEYAARVWRAMYDKAESVRFFKPE